MKVLAMLLILLSLVACTGAKIKSDPSLSAMQANYPSAEFTACGQRWHGLGICPLYSDEFLDSIDLNVQGYFDGDMRVFSSSEDSGCQMDFHTTYHASELVKIPVKQTSSACTFSISVSPRIPGIDDQHDVTPQIFSGFLRVRKLHVGDFWNGDVIFTPENGTTFIEIPTPETNQTLVSLRGCGLDYDGSIDPRAGRFEIDLQGIHFVQKPKLCTIEGVVFGEDFAKWSRLLAVYKEGFVPLAKPAVLEDDQEITVYADPTVYAIFLDNEFKLSNVGEFKFDSAQEHVLRLLTSSARSVIGEYSPSSHTWTWR